MAAIFRWAAGLGLAACVSVVVGADIAGDGAQATVAAAAWRQVAATLDVTGEMHGPATRGAEPARQAIAMRATFDFLESPGPAAADAVAVRTYREAAANMVVDGVERKSSLPVEARSLAVAKLGTTPLPYLPGAYLTRDESDLLETPFDSLLLEDLLPGRPVTEADRWRLPGDLVAGLLAIDTVETGAIEARIVAIDEGVARVSLEGVVDGAVDGVPTHVVVDGEFNVSAEPDEDGHVLVGDVSRIDAVIKERRQASHVAAGFDIEARVTVARSSGSPPDAEAAPAADQAAGRRRGPGGPGMVWHRDPEGRYDLVHESGWRCVEEDAGGIVLRLLDLGALVAQCSITAMPRSADAAVPSVEDVKRSVEQSLVGQFKRFDGATEAVRAEDGVRVVRVVSEGTAENLPFRWVHYVLTDGEGHRVNVTFMLESSLEKRFAEAGTRLVAGLRLGPGTPREARLPRKTEVP